LRRGDWVVAIGNPLGFSGTATAGIVSAIGKPGDFQRSRSYTDFLQIDAAINRGNSGGPTFNMNGQVVGVNSWIASTSGGSIGLGFAIPAELVDDVTQTLISEGKVSRGYLGVLIGNVTEDIAAAIGLDEPNGAIVSSVTKDGPADKSGLERGDIIIKVNGTSVSDATTTTRLVGALAAGSRNKFEVLRDGKSQVINVTVGERPDNLGLSAITVPDTEDESEGKEGPLGVTLRPLDKETREKLNLASDEAGMIITELDSDSVLYKEGIRAGMVILDVNYKKLDSLTVLEKELSEARSSGRNRLLMAVHTGNGTVFIAVDVSEDD
jgi:serine protease Do